MKQNQSWITGSQNWVSKFGTRRHTLGSRPLAKSTLGQFPVEVVCPVVPFYPCSSDYEHGFHEADSPILLEAWQPFQFVEVLHRGFLSCGKSRIMPVAMLTVCQENKIRIQIQEKEAEEMVRTANIRLVGRTPCVPKNPTWVIARYSGAEASATRRSEKSNLDWI